MLKLRQTHAVFTLLFSYQCLWKQDTGNHSAGTPENLDHREHINSSALILNQELQALKDPKKLYALNIYIVQPHTICTNQPCPMCHEYLHPSLQLKEKWQCGSSCAGSYPKQHLEEWVSGNNPKHTPS